MIVVPIWKKPEEKASVLAAADAVVAAAAKAGVRAKVDAAEQRTPGWKYNHWEMKARRGNMRINAMLTCSTCAFGMRVERGVRGAGAPREGARSR